jgi:antitoxin component YwqK of YwqJK toxin-antitoxin module
MDYGGYKRPMKLFLLPLLTAYAFITPCTSESDEGYGQRFTKIFPDCTDSTNYYLTVTSYGKLSYEGSYYQDKKDGVFTFYDTSGNITQLLEFSCGTPVFQRTYWKGYMAFVWMRINDSIDRNLSYFRNGNVKDEFYSVNGHAVSPGMEYDSVGTTKFTGDFYPKAIVDTILYENPNTGLMDMVLCPDERKKHGTWIRYNLAGEVVERVVYDKGRVVRQP